MEARGGRREVSHCCKAETEKLTGGERVGRAW